MKKTSFVIVLSFCTIFYGSRSTPDFDTLLILDQRIDYNIRSSNWSLAYLQLKKMLKYRPNQSEYVYALVKVCAILEKHQEAIEILEKGGKYLSNYEEKIKSQSWLGMLLAFEGKFHQSLRNINSCIRICNEVKINDTLLLANLYNNAACLGIFASAVERNSGEEPHISFSEQKLYESIQLLKAAVCHNPYDTVISNNLYYLKHVYTSYFKALKDTGNKNLVSCKTPPKFKVNGKNEISRVENGMLQGLEGFMPRLRKYREIIMIIDYSQSMEIEQRYYTSTQTERISRDALMKQSASYILANLTAQNRIGALTVGGICGNSPLIQYHINDEVKKETLLQRILQIEPYGATPLNERFRDAQYLFTDQKSTTKALVLLSDGLSNCGPELDICQVSEELANQGIDVYVLSFLLENRNFIREYAYYNCMAIDVLGITEDLKVEDKNLNISTQISPISFPKRIKRNTCLPGLERLKVDCNYLKIPRARVKYDKLFVEF